MLGINFCLYRLDLCLNVTNLFKPLSIFMNCFKPYHFTAPSMPWKLNEINCEFSSELN